MMATKIRTRELTRIMVYEASGNGVLSAERASASDEKVGVPGDMLRYDHAFESALHPGVLVFVSYKVKGSGTYSGWPTVDRWRSFSVKLTERKDLTENIQHDLRQHGDAWFTYVHPVSSYELVKKSFTEFFAEEAK